MASLDDASRTVDRTRSRPADGDVREMTVARLGREKEARDARHGSWRRCVVLD